jgi:hypothetical protein
MYVVQLHKIPFVSPWRRGLVVLYPPATEETGAMGREIESRQGIGWYDYIQTHNAKRTTACIKYF